MENSVPVKPNGQHDRYFGYTFRLNSSIPARGLIGFAVNS